MITEVIASKSMLWPDGIPHSYDMFHSWGSLMSVVILNRRITTSSEYLISKKYMPRGSNVNVGSWGLGWCVQYFLQTNDA